MPSSVISADVDDRRHQHRQHQLELRRRSTKVLPRSPCRRAARARTLTSGRDADQQADVEREVARPAARPSAQPAPRRTLSEMTIAPSSEEQRRDGELERASWRRDGRVVVIVGPCWARATPCAAPRSAEPRRRGRTCSAHLREEAGFLHQLHVALLFLRHPVAYSLPVSAVWLKAPSSMNFFHSGVARTFLNRST